ncbi:hypothetical protein C8P68_102613 [Mucilaginibacter yixingensis]|uniref:Uncharacterized protein n=1 Tax=Mucilaginibacter yixingensis TaxID=1295612 RepID=A0A2T5JDF7_9SPHI|nr:hypothetical protein [Mucilaginibacter yixingensis]PTQ99783.1 hypothetical protein C8P68_102613 [Mucilaginibacter yixingensis]
MKTIIKHISLLLWSGLIIPCCFICCFNGKAIVAADARTPCHPNGKSPVPCFDLVRDVAAKLLPVLNFF